MKFLVYPLTLLMLISCIEPDPSDNIKKAKPKTSVDLMRSQTETAVAIKNFLQVNNTFSKLTGVSPSEGDISDEFEAIKLQLPSSTDPLTLNGFNQIASTRLAFAYCDEYIDINASDYDFSSNDSNNAELQTMAVKFADFDFANNSDHQEFLANLNAIMNDEDGLIDDGNAASKKRKLMKMSCSAVLSSTYVTLL